MTIIDWFIQGVGYGACAVGFVLLFFGVMGCLVTLIGAVLGKEAGDDDLHRSSQKQYPSSR